MERREVLNAEGFQVLYKETGLDSFLLHRDFEPHARWRRWGWIIQWIPATEVPWIHSVCQNHTFKREQFHVEELQLNKLIKIPHYEHYNRDVGLLPCPPPQIMDHLEILNLEFLGFFFIFSYLLWGGTTQHTEVRRQLVGVNSPTIWVRDVKLRSSGLADTQLYRLSHLTSSPLKEFWFYFFGGCRCFKFYLLTFTCVSNLLAYMFVHHVNAYLEPTEAQRRHWDPGTGHRWCRLLYVPRFPGKAVNAF